jgi:hypothetical protein
MKLSLLLASLCLSGTVLANVGDCVINKKYRGTGTLTERPSRERDDIVVQLEIDIKSDRWRGVIARKDLSGTFVDIKVPQKHKYAVGINQNIRGTKLTYDYLSPGYNEIMSDLKINKAQEITSVTAHETIYDDFGRVDGKNTIRCKF